MSGVINLSQDNKMPLWKVASVEDKPSVRLKYWAIKKTDQGEYFVGDEIGGRGRVSTRIIEFDEERKVGRTASGRVYELVGNSDYSSDGEYVWNYYKEINNLTELPEEPVEGTAHG
jgi:hypothetical protein